MRVSTNIIKAAFYINLIGVLLSATIITIDFFKYPLEPNIYNILFIINGTANVLIDLFIVIVLYQFGESKKAIPFFIFFLLSVFSFGLKLTYPVGENSLPIYTLLGALSFILNIVLLITASGLKTVQLRGSYLTFVNTTFVVQLLQIAMPLFGVFIMETQDAQFYQYTSFLFLLPRLTIFIILQKVNHLLRNHQNSL